MLLSFEDILRDAEKDREFDKDHFVGRGMDNNLPEALLKKLTRENREGKTKIWKAG